MSKGGRPLKSIDKGQFEKLCGMQCTQIEIASFFSVSEDTIERWCKRTYKKGFAEVFREKRCAGMISLRRTQFKLAEKSTAMAIFLGKNYLGQTDHVEITDSTPIERLDAILNSIKGVAENAVKPENI